MLENLIFGHLVGDYLLQNKWMAMNKSASTLKCLIHCMIYTIVVGLFTYSITGFNLYWILIIFLSHFPIDRWSLADKWLMLINGRSLKDFLENGYKNIPETGFDEKKNYHVLRGGFSALVYTVVDNTMHLLLMYYGYKFFIG